jgi:tight adherence protein C
MDTSTIQWALTIAAIGLLSIAGIGGVVAGFRTLTLAGKRRARLDSGGTTASTGPSAAKVAAGRIVEQVQRLGDQIAVRDPSQLTALRSQMILAGYFSREAVTIYLGAKVAALIAATAFGILVIPWSMTHGGGMVAILLAIAPAIAAILGPEQVLKARRRARELEYRDGFPDFLDLLVASVEAGLSLDAAIGRVSDEIGRRHPNLAEHIRFLTLELRAGRPRKEAWSSFAERLGIDEARALATMLRQAEEMGTSLGETLNVFSVDMRQRRMLRAEEKAMALPAKLMVPLILFIFPCLLGVLILPAAFHISQTLAK